MSVERAQALLAALDRTQAISALDRFGATMTIAELRRHGARVPHRDAVLAQAALSALERWPLHSHARAAALGALVDVGHLDVASDRIVARLRAGDATVADLRVAARILRLRGNRNSGIWLHELADQLLGGGARLTTDTIETIVDRLLGRWLPEGHPFESAPIDGDIEPDALEKLERPIDVPGIDGLRLRPIESRQQLDRFSSHLKNCASSYLPLVRSGATRLLGLEMDGTPVELIEVHPRTGRVKQWKGRQNAAADSVRRGVVEPFLLEQRLVRGL